MAHDVGVYVYPGHQMLDLAGPTDVLQAAGVLEGRHLYDIQVLSRSGGLIPSTSGIMVDSKAAPENQLGTLMVVGGSLEILEDGRHALAIKDLSRCAERVVSICTGAFLLADAGLLDGKRVATHWGWAQELQQRHQAVRVDADRIFIVDGRIWTSAGVTAGIDLALAIVEADHGAALARAVAKMLVVYHRRPGGQSQFSALSQLEPDSDRIRLALAFAREHLSEPLPLERLAEASHLSTRQFGRAFRQATGETPAKAIERLRVEAARIRLKEGSEPVEVIARAVGFQDPERMRRAFIKRFGYPPQDVRRTGS